MRSGACCRLRNGGVDGAAPPDVIVHCIAAAPSIATVAQTRLDNLCSLLMQNDDGK
jgi:hypothetical protein